MHPFEQAWNLTQKSDFYFNNRDQGFHNVLELGSHAGTEVRQKVDPESLEGFEKPTRMQRFTGKRNRMFNEAFNSLDPDKHVETPFQPDLPFTDNTATRFHGKNYFGSGPEKLEGFSAEERKERGENLEWDPQANEGKGNFRRGASRPRMSQKPMQTASAQVAPVDSEGEWINGRIDRHGKLWSNRPAKDRQAVRLKEPTNLATFEGANLSAQQQWDTDRIGEEKAKRLASMSGGKKWGDKTEDEMIDSLSSTLLHEGVHGAIQGELDEAVMSGELSQANRTRADEIGAFSGQHFGDPEKVNEAMGYHDDVDRDARMPQPLTHGDIARKSFQKAWSLVKYSDDCKADLIACLKQKGGAASLADCAEACCLSEAECKEMAISMDNVKISPHGDVILMDGLHKSDDETPFQYDTDKYHDQEKNEEIQRILDDIAQRNYEESQAREPTDIEELMAMVEEYEDTGYDGPTDSGPLWENRWNISPPAAGWRMFADSASEYNVEHLLNSGWDPEHIRIIRLGPGEHTPWGYMGGQDTVWVSSASPEFNQTMAHYVKDEPEDYDPWRAME